MKVFHPRSWLRDMPKGARFYVSKEDLRIEHPGITEAEIVTAAYSGPGTEEFLVLEPKAPAKKVLKLSGNMTVLDVPNAGQPQVTAVEPASAEEAPPSVPTPGQDQPAAPEPEKPAKGKKTNSKKSNA